jgi:hypothetical protein
MSWRALLAPYIFVTGSLIFALPACWAPTFGRLLGGRSLRYLFENCALDTDRRELLRGAELVAIPPQVFGLLDYLIRNRERGVSKDDRSRPSGTGVLSPKRHYDCLNAARNATKTARNSASSRHCRAKVSVRWHSRK